MRGSRLSLVGCGILLLAGGPATAADNSYAGTGVAAAAPGSPVGKLAQGIIGALNMEMLEGSKPDLSDSTALEVIGISQIDTNLAEPVGDDGTVSMPSGFGSPPPGSKGSFPVNGKTPPVVPFAFRQNGVCYGGYVTVAALNMQAHVVNMHGKPCDAHMVLRAVTGEYDRILGAPPAIVKAESNFDGHDLSAPEAAALAEAVESAGSSPPRPATSPPDLLKGVPLENGPLHAQPAMPHGDLATNPYLQPLSPQQIPTTTTPPTAMAQAGAPSAGQTGPGSTARGHVGDTYQLFLVPGSSQAPEIALRLNVTTGETVMSLGEGPYFAVNDPTPIGAGSYKIYSYATFDSASKQTWDAYRLDKRSGRLWHIAYDGKATASWAEIVAAQ